MKASDRAIIFGVALVALTLGFYLFVLGPKRDKASELGNQVKDLHASIATAQQQVSYGEQARKDFPRYYGRMVVLGKAVPAQSDTASMLVQLNSISHNSEVHFGGITLGDASASAGTGTSSPTAPAPAAPAASTAASTPTTATPSSTATGAAPSSSPAGSSTATATPSLVPATEASAAAQPIGAVVGTAGLPTLPYTLTLDGGYFQVANFIGEIDGLVKPVDDGAQLSPNGRLFTVNGFALDVQSAGPPATLAAKFLVTTYSTGDLGTTAGASPTGPAPVSPTQPQAQPASAVVSK